MDRKLYIHIGPHKTGTTTIQFNLNANQQLLTSKGILVPKAGRLQLKNPASHHLAWEIRQDRRFNKAKGTWSDLLAELNDQPDIKKVIVSSEEFEFLKLDQIEELHRITRQFDVYIVMYLRRQDQALQSIWTELIKSPYKPKHFNSFYDWLIQVNYYTPIIDYPQRIEDWGNIFGVKNLLIGNLNYQLYKNSLFDDFLNLCGIQLNNLQYVPNRNVSPGVKTIEAIRLFKQSFAIEELPTDKWKQIVHKIIDYGDIQEWNEKRINYLYPELSEKIMNMYFETNQDISRNIFNRDKLFDDISNSNWKINTFTFEDFSKKELLGLFYFIIKNCCL